MDANTHMHEQNFKFQISEIIECQGVYVYYICIYVCMCNANMGAWVVLTREKRSEQSSCKKKYRGEGEMRQMRREIIWGTLNEVFFFFSSFKVY